MPTEQEHAIRESLRKAHPDWSEEKIDRVTYAKMTKQGWRPQKRYGGKK